MPFERSLDEPAAASGPACVHLRNKGMFVTGQMDPALIHESAAGHCWCLRTQDVFGPDCGSVGRLACTPGRPCYESL
jgi:hypothetical protein